MQNSADAPSAPIPNPASAQRGDRLREHREPCSATSFPSRTGYRKIRCKHHWPQRMPSERLSSVNSNGNTTTRETQHRAHRAARLPQPAPLGPPLPLADASSGASGEASERATHLLKAPSANRRRHRSHIPGWAQGVNRHPRLVPKAQKESRKAIDAIKSGSERRITQSDRTQFALPPLFGEGA